MGDHPTLAASQASQSLVVNHHPSEMNLAIKQLLVARLQAALDLYIGTNPLICLNRAKRQLKGYTCAIAQKLSKTLELPPLEIALALAEIVCQQTDQQEFTIQVLDRGWIYLELTDSYLAAWLQHLIQSPPSFQTWKAEGSGEAGGEKPLTPHPSPLVPHPSSPFTIQYAHARCCSILQLAHTEQLITLQPTDPNLGSALWLAVSPNPIPWLNQQICLYHPAQLALISQLIAILDDLYCPKPSTQPMNWYKAALNLSQAFQTFYSQCRIWGEVKSQHTKLAQTRLGLVLITQSVLRLLLLQLGIIAPSEL